MAYSAYQNSDNIVPYYVALVADTEADIQTLPTDFAPGSTCIVTQGSSLWMLGNDSIWHNMTVED